MRIMQEEYGMFSQSGNDRVKRLVYESATRNLEELYGDVRKYEGQVGVHYKLHSVEPRNEDREPHVHDRFRYLYYKLKMLSVQTRYSEGGDSETLAIAGSVLHTALSDKKINCKGWKNVKV